MKLLKLLILSIFLSGGFPLFDLASLQAESSEQQKKKKKKRKKKKSNKSSSSKKKRKKKSSKNSSSKKKKKKKKKKKIASEESSTSQKSTKPVSIESANSTKNSKSSSSASYADELFTLTGELESSNRELARATRYFNENEVQPKLITTDSKPFFSTDDFEKESRLNPDDIYVQRQLGLHYESKGDYDSAKEVYLREVRKNPGNPDAHYFLGHCMPTLVRCKKQSFRLKKLYI